MSVQVLIASFQDSILRVPALLATLPADTNVLIVHQNPAGRTYAYQSLFDSPHVEVHPMTDRGLARSRNAAVRLATADVLIPTDADVRFLPGAIAAVIGAFERHPDAGVLTFQALDGEGRYYRTYPSAGRRHSLRTIRRVFSIEIAVRRTTLAAANLGWDEDFGLNARYPGGLELAFMKNVLDRMVPAYYVPTPIVVHDGPSTGHAHTPASAVFRGAVYAKLFGYFALPLLAGFAAKNAWRAGSPASAARYVTGLYRGALDYLARR